MLASALCNLVQKGNPDWTTAQILGIVQDIVNMVLKRETDSQVYVDPTTGDLPWLATTGGTYTYNISLSVPVWKVANVLVDYTELVPNINDPNLVLTGPTAYGLTISGANNMNNDTLFQDVKFGSKIYRKAPCLISDQIGNIPPIVTFTFDPTTTTQLYRVMAYQTPASALGLGSYIPLPDKLQYTLIACVQDIMDALDNGRFGDVWAQVQTMWLPQFIFDTDKDTQMIYSNNYSW